MESKTTTNTKDIQENRLTAALSYISILSLVILLVKRDSPFAQFHARQGLVLFIAEVLGWVIAWIPGINMLLFLAFVILSILGFWNAYQGRWWKMPFAAQIAEKIKL